MIGQYVPNHRQILTGGIILVIISALAALFFKEKLVAAGLFFGFSLSILNYLALALTIKKAMVKKSKRRVKVFIAAGYYLRFLAMVLILYLVVPEMGFDFGLASLAGLLVLKIIFFINNIRETLQLNKRNIISEEGGEKA